MYIGHESRRPPLGVPVMEELAGKDMTKEFCKTFCALIAITNQLTDRYHAWVNYEMLLDRCLLGFIVD